MNDMPVRVGVGKRNVILHQQENRVSVKCDALELYTLLEEKKF